MVYLEYVATDGDEVVYDYMPEREDAPHGTISVNASTLERALVKASSDDELPWYRSHAWREIERMIKDGDLLARTSVAWY